MLLLLILQYSSNRHKSFQALTAQAWGRGRQNYYVNFFESKKHFVKLKEKPTYQIIYTNWKRWIALYLKIGYIFLYSKNFFVWD